MSRANYSCIPLPSIRSSVSLVRPTNHLILIFGGLARPSHLYFKQAAGLTLSNFLLYIYYFTNVIVCLLEEHPKALPRKDLVLMDEFSSLPACHSHRQTSTPILFTPSTYKWKCVGHQLICACLRFLVRTSLMTCFLV